MFTMCFSTAGNNFFRHLSNSLPPLIASLHPKSSSLFICVPSGDLHDDEMYYKLYFIHVTRVASISITFKKTRMNRMSIDILVSPAICCTVTGKRPRFHANRRQTRQPTTQITAPKTQMEEVGQNCLIVEPFLAGKALL